MRLLCTRCWTGLTPARTSTGGCRCCPPLRGMWTRHGQFVLVPGSGPGAAGARQSSPGAAARGAPMTALAPALQAYFTDRLITQRNSSPETIASYRDAFKLLLRFAHERTGKQPFE